MSMLFGSATKEDLLEDDGPMAISSSMKEDLAREYDDYSPIAISSSMREDLKIRKKRYKNGIKYHDRKKI
jgi:hypothetical protein